MRHLSAFLLLCGTCIPAVGNAQKLVTEGYVTSVSSPSAFDFNGMHVILSPQTTFVIKHSEAAPKYSSVVPVLPQLYLGEALEMTGIVEQHSTEIKASEIVVLPPPSPIVSGTGIIDLMPGNSSLPSDLSGGRLVRADGYLLFIPAGTKVALTQPIPSVEAAHTNQWITYHGKQRPDGVVIVDQAGLAPNTVNHREDKLRIHGDYDPSAIDEGDAQSGASKFFKGKDAKRLPAWHDAAMQARVDRIGKSLIPAFQKALPEDDPTRIDFRFQVIDEPKHSNARAFASGIILIPHQFVERLPDDSQLAAILANSIAEVLEKQDLRSVPTKQKMTAIGIAGEAVDFVVPGVATAALIANHEVSRSMVDHEHQQSGRVSLCLMHDAGYDLAAAPKAWWRLAAKSGSDPLPKRLPEHTLFLYEDLGTTWRKPSHTEPTAKH